MRKLFSLFAALTLSVGLWATPDCEKVQGVKAINPNEVGATIYWNKGSATQWEIVVANEELTPNEIAAGNIAIVKDSITSENPFVVDYCDETPKIYYTYVRALCGDDNKGEWSNAISFKTTCVAKTTEGYGFIDFAADGFGTSEFYCWTRGKREGTTADPSVKAGSHLYMFNSTASEGAYAIMPPIDVDSIKRLQVKFTASGGTDATYLRKLTVGIISNPTDLSTFEAIETVDLPKAVTAINKTNHAKNLDEAQTFIVRFNNYAGDKDGAFGKQIMFLSENHGVANYIYIYSMEVDTISSCWEPVHLTEVEVNAYDATMSWEEVGTNYQVQLLADDKTTVLVDRITNEQQMKFEGLTMLTNYYVQVRTICGAGDTSAWSPMGNFTTQCPVAYELPYEENFDSYTAKTTAPRVEPNCWTTWYDGLDAVTASIAYCYIYASAKKSGTNGFYMGSTTGNSTGTTPAKQSLVALPAINGLNAALLHFNAKASTTTGTRALKIGVAEYAEPYDSILSSVTWVDSVENIGKDWTYYTFDLSTYMGAGKHIVIMCYGGNTSATSLSTTALYTYIDDIYVEKMPSCFRPIDLGLPSGLKWATFNVGATTPEGYGDYFAWGETAPHQDNNYSSSKYTYTDNPTTLPLDHDAAYVNWGSDWRMPTKAEQDELREECTWTWTEDYNGTGIKGYIVTSKAEGNNNSIFLPASGYRDGSSLYYVGSYGYYWSSSLDEGYTSGAYNLGFDSGIVGWYGNFRYYGQSVRPVTTKLIVPVTPKVGDQFVDTTSVLKFEVTAVGDTNTVKVIKNDYTGTSYTVPDTVKYLDVDFAVTEIGGEAFQNCESLQSITLPEGLLTIGEQAFVVTGLTSIIIPASVTEIEMGAFAMCSGLTSVTFLGNACQEGIGNNAFKNVGKTDPALLTLPNSWTGTLPDEDGNWYGGVFNLSEEPTALPTLIGDGVKGNKFMHNGQLIIRNAGKTYNAVGF